MFNVCNNCGLFRADKEIDRGGPDAICPECGHRHRFQYLPLMIICGPAGAGKTTICNQLVGKLQEVVILDGDILWRPAFNDPANNYRAFFETWVSLAKNIGQSGRPVVIFNSGAIPSNIEPVIESRYFPSIHYLALVYDDDLLEKRLKARPEWRGSGSDEFIAEQTRFNYWFKNEGVKEFPQIDLLDTSHDRIEVTVDKVATWIRSKL